MRSSIVSLASLMSMAGASLLSDLGASLGRAAPRARGTKPYTLGDVGKVSSSSNGGHRGLGKANHRKAMKARRVKAHRARG